MKVDTSKESQMTTSQESYLRKCPFAGQPEIIQCDDNDSDSSSVRIIMAVSPPGSPAHGDSNCSSNTELTLDILLGLKSLSSGEDEPKEEDSTTYDLGSSDKGKEPMVNPDLGRKRTLDLTKNPIVEKPTTTTTTTTAATTENDIFNNILDALKMVAGDHVDNAGGSDEVDLLEMAKKRGMSFPRPRWWKDIMPCDDAVKLSIKRKNSTKQQDQK